MASADTGKLKVNVIVTGFSVPTNPERWVRLRIAASNGRSVERVFSYLGLNNDPRPLIGAASAIGIPLIRSGAKQEFMALVEAALSKADQSAADPPPAFEPVTRVGWHRNVFVTPRTFYPYPQNSLELCLGEVRGSLSYQRKGSLGQWNRAFRWSLQRNPYLLFAASLSLAPSLLKFANLEGCIICLVGPTSRGKTTLLDLSGSARGGFPSKKLGFKDSWGTTANALEQLAIQANDTLLILDDIQNVPGSIYQRAALLDYAAFNLPSGREKDRMTQIHAPREWRTIALTSSNRTLADVLERGGMQWDPSHGVRFIEIPITNAFSNVPEGLFPAQFAERLARKTRWAYGAPLHWFLDLVAAQVTTPAKEAAFRQRIKTEIAAVRTRFRIPPSDGATNRVASYFALIEIAGGMAADDGILPVSRRAVRDAVEHVWTAYKSDVSGAVPVSGIEGLRNYIKVHRHEFADARGSKPKTGASHAGAPGYVTESDRSEEFSFSDEQFKALCPPGFTVKQLCDCLRRDGLLVHDTGSKKSSGKNQTKRRIYGNRMRVYCVSAKILSNDRGASDPPLRPRPRHLRQS